MLLRRLYQNKGEFVINPLLKGVRRETAMYKATNCTQMFAESRAFELSTGYSSREQQGVPAHNLLAEKRSSNHPKSHESNSSALFLHQECIRL
ncbi:unnamed protein product [Hymenolepis diminuta]|uniref:Uncharacterized protein n=1 Tax=Hymenolepis diminuta TaxID=6216 RepID=A0A564YS11_HYMDI|nr:unnamed protein product [Hymenolepis diminuta]